MHAQTTKSPFMQLSEKLKLSYPTQWTFKLIVSATAPHTLDLPALRLAIDAIIHKPYELQTSRSSARGKFHSLNLSLTLESETKRHQIYQELCNINSVHYVL